MSSELPFLTGPTAALASPAAGRAEELLSAADALALLPLIDSDETRTICSRTSPIWTPPTTSPPRSWLAWSSCGPMERSRTCSSTYSRIERRYLRELVQDER